MQTVFDQFEVLDRRPYCVLLFPISPTSFWRSIFFLSGKIRTYFDAAKLALLCLGGSFQSCAVFSVPGRTYLGFYAACPFVQDRYTTLFPEFPNNPVKSTWVTFDDWPIHNLLGGLDSSPTTLSSFQCGSGVLAGTPRDLIRPPLVDRAGRRQLTQ